METLNKYFIFKKLLNDDEKKIKDERKNYFKNNLKLKQKDTEFKKI